MQNNSIPNAKASRIEQAHTPLSDSYRVQFLLVLICWLITVAFHWGNDGIWWQGDSPRHAMNSVFYLDLVQHGMHNPNQFAKEYYARYPAIVPQRYPPFLYLTTAICFACFGISTFIAKFVVHLFALLLGIYTLLALRRWISPRAGLVAGYVLLMPGFMIWSGAFRLSA